MLVREECCLSEKFQEQRKISNVCPCTLLCIVNNNNGQNTERENKVNTIKDEIQF